MKLRSCACIVALVVLGGCASMHDQAATQAQPSSQQPTIDVDYAYVAKIEHQAREHNAGIEWINPPIHHAGSSSHH